MSLDSIEKELISIAEETQQQVLYLQELGIDSFESTVIHQPGTAKTHVTAMTAAPSSTAHNSQISAISPKAVQPQPNLIRTAPKTTGAPPTVDSLFGNIFQTPEEKLPESDETFEQIRADVGDCTRCGLCEGRTNIVHTEGNPKARLMFVGEAPGADEDAQARPFVGRAGQLLTKIIEALGLRREDVLIGNINRCRPPGNRTPTPDEVMMCKPFLLREIAVARPEVIVVLGNTAMKNLLDIKEGITRVRGIFQNYKGVKVMPTFHPAYLLRDPAKKRETWEDLKKVRDYLDNTSSERT